MRAKDGGALERPGHTEAAVDLTRLAGFSPAGVLCELVNDDGTMATGEALVRFAEDHRIVTITIEQIADFRRGQERLVRHVSQAEIPTPHGRFVAHAYASVLDGTEHVALVAGDVRGGAPPLVRIHSECLAGDVFGSAACPCAAELQAAMGRIGDEGRGVIVYLRSDQTWEGAQILADLGVTEARHLADELAENVANVRSLDAKRTAVAHRC